jgi:hypothetical protein
MKGNGEALRTSGDAADSSFSEQPVGSPQKPCKPKTWVDFRLVDPDGKPVSGMRYRLEDSEGRTAEGTTDSDGCAGEEGIDPGSARITFLGMDSSARRN